MNRHTLTKTAFALGLLGCLGCGSGTHPLSGTITFTDGEPARELAGGVVEIESVDAEPKVNGRGVIKEDGSFVVHTYQSGDGAVAGKHRVLIMPPLHSNVVSDMPGSSGPQRLPLIIDPRYSSYETSGLEIEVPAAANSVSLQIERLGALRQ